MLLLFCNDRNIKLRMKFGKKEEEGPKVIVKTGSIGETKVYKYLGDWYDETGDNKEKNGKKVNQIKNIIYNVCVPIFGRYTYV